MAMKKDRQITSMEERRVRGRVWSTLDGINDGRPARLADRNRDEYKGVGWPKPTVATMDFEQVERREEDTL